MNKYKSNEIIEEYSFDGDIININNNPSFWSIHSRIGCWGIRRSQKSLFKGAVHKYNDGVRKLIIIDPTDDTHSMVKFSRRSIVEHILNNDNISEAYQEKVEKILNKNKWSKVFSVEPPRATFIPVDDFSTDDISIYRYNHKNIDYGDISLLLRGTLSILGTKYDYGQLINILINQMLGYAYDEKVKWFDLGCKRKVCSVGVAAIYQYRKLNSMTKINRLFSKLNNNAWSKDFVEKFIKNGGKWNVENTYPAMFGLTDSHFNNETRLVLKMNKGKIQYLSK